MTQVVHPKYRHYVVLISFLERICTNLCVFFFKKTKETVNMYFSSVYFCCHSFHKLLHYMYLCAAIQQFCFLDLSKAFSFLFCFYSLLIRTVRICVLHTFSLIFIKYHTNCAHHSNQILFYIFVCVFSLPLSFLLYPPFLFS